MGGSAQGVWSALDFFMGQPEEYGQPTLAQRENLRS